MNTFRKNKFIYEEILELEELFNNTPMEYIKENLYQIKLNKKEQYVKNCRNNDKIIGRFRVLDDLVSEHAEHSYFNKSHPSNIPFMTLIKICNHLKINFEDVIKTPVERISIPNTNKIVKWTEEKIQEFINNYNNGMRIEHIGKIYNISANSVIRFYELFNSGKDVNGRIRNNRRDGEENGNV